MRIYLIPTGEYNDTQPIVSRCFRISTALERAGRYGTGRIDVCEEDEHGLRLIRTIILPSIPDARRGPLPVITEE